MDWHFHSYLKIVHEPQFIRTNRSSAEIAHDLETEYQGRKEKKEAVKRRRSDFNRERDKLLLKMLARGDAYICSREGCNENRNLEIDHIDPLSKGGSNRLENLQFLCRLHNSQKGDIN